MIESAMILVAAMLLDAAVGEPKWIWSRAPHPAVLMGRCVALLDRHLNRAPLARMAGVVALAIMIALAGIIVRNSILLVDFIMEEQRAGKSLEDAVVRAASVRAKPIVLTAIAAMMGGFFILDDPIFNGLAVSLIFGIFVSTVLTLVVIPVLYYAFGYSKG